MTTFKRTSILLLTVTALGCSMKKDMEEAKDATQDMRGATHRLETLTNSVESSSNNIYFDGREGGTMNMLRESFNQMLKGGRKSVVRKIEYATVYFCSFEYQFWRGQRQDNEEYRQILMAKAVDLFFAEIDDLIDETYPMSVFNIYSTGFDNWLNLSVLAMAMDRVHDRQIITAKEQKFKVYSMLDLITEGLEYKTLAQRGAPVPEFANKVLQREQQAIYLLQLRQNFYPLIVLGLATNFDESLWQMATKAYMPWTFDYSFANSKQLTMWTEFLERAHTTREWLLSHEIPVRVNAQVQGTFANIRRIIAPPQNDEDETVNLLSFHFRNSLKSEGLRIR